MDSMVAVPIVLETLTRATSQNTDVLKPAEEQLKKWETERGFYSILFAIFSNHDIDINVRWQAVIYFKNGVDRYWRKTAPSSIDENEKSNLRKLLISNFNEPVNQVATQLAVLISKVARYDCPREWPELIPTLLTAVRSEDELLQHRALLTLRHVTKSLSSKRLAGDRRIFQELTSNIFRFILNLWDNHTEAFLRCEGNAMLPLEKGILALKILQKLTVHGMKEPQKVDDALLFLKSIFTRLKTMLECRVRIQSDDHLREMCEKYIILLTKVLMDVLDNHPFSFISFIKPSLELSVTYLFTEDGKGKLFERFTIQCLNLMKKIIMCAEYHPAKASEVPKDPSTLQAHNLKLEFFTPPILIEICQQIISHYLLLTEEELQVWQNNPEEFATDEGGEAWKFSLRPCVEGVFLTLFYEFRQTLTPVILELMQSTVAPCDLFDLKKILSKDAIYNAFGLVAGNLYDEVNFDQWFSEILRKELQIKCESYKIIRRRVVWLIGQWIHVKLASELRPALYDTILPLLSQDEDIIVRLAAARTLKIAIDDFEFSTEQFMPYLQTAFGLLFQLLQQAEEGDTKMNVLNVLCFLIERVGTAIQPHADNLIQYLPQLWNEADSHNMLRCAILTVLIRLIQGLGSESTKLYPFLIPVIQYSTDLSEPHSVYLMEDALELWLVTLENASSLHPSLLQLYPKLIPLLDNTSEIRPCLHIIQAYILLGPQEFLQNIASAVVTWCCNLLPEVKTEGVVMLMRLIEVVLKALPDDGPHLFTPVLPQVFKTIISGQEFPMVLSMYLSVVARVLINSQSCFKSNLDIVANETDGMTEKLLGRLLDVWLDKMPLVTQMERRKLLGIALAALLTCPTSVVLERICGILLAVVEVLNDIIKTDDIGAQVDSLVLSSTDEDDPYSLETEHQRRKKQLLMKDPIHTVVLKDYLKSQLMQLQQRLGPNVFDQLMQTVDIETMSQLQEYMQEV